MAMLFFDGFDTYATAQLSSVWPWFDNTDISAGTGRRGTQSLFLSHISWGYSEATQPLSGQDEIFMGWAHKIGHFSNGSGWIAMTYSGPPQSYNVGASYPVMIGLQVSPTGVVSAWINSGSTWGSALGSTPAGTMAAGVFYYLEWNVKLHDTAGRIILRLNGVPIISLTDIDTDLGRGKAFAGIGPRGYAYVDDLYILDTSGSTNNTFLGDTRVDAHYPVTPDGTHHDWTPSTGSDNFAVVDDPVCNTTDYNSTTTLHAVDTFNMEHLKNTGSTIAAVQTRLFYTKADAGACLIAPVIRSGGADYVGGNLAPSTDSFATTSRLLLQNPDGPHAWSEADFNDIEVGYEKTG